MKKHHTFGLIGLTVGVLAGAAFWAVAGQSITNFAYGHGLLSSPSSTTSGS